MRCLVNYVLALSAFSYCLVFPGSTKLVEFCLKMATRISEEWVLDRVGLEHNKLGIFSRLNTSMQLNTNFGIF